MWRYVHTQTGTSWIDQDKINQVEPVSDEVTAVYFDDGRRLELLENPRDLVEQWEIVRPINAD